jgi:hypothetical protein
VEYSLFGKALSDPFGILADIKDRMTRGLGLVVISGDMVEGHDQGETLGTNRSDPGEQMPRKSSAFADDRRIRPRRARYPIRNFIHGQVILYISVAD